MKFLTLTPAILMASSLVLGAGGAWAEVKVENQVLQSGMFVKQGCKPRDIEGFNDCACLADIHVPVLSGLSDEALQKQVNDGFRASAEKQKCEGVESTTESKDEPASSTYNFDITYQSPALLALRYDSWAYTGGAHGNGVVEGVILDIAKGKRLTLPDIFGSKDLKGVNNFIHDALSAEPEGEVFHDSIEAFKGEFITPSECKSCTVVLAEDGLKVVFQTYAVASFANGPMEVTIPAQYAVHPAIKAALANLKPATPPTENTNAER